MVVQAGDEGVLLVDTLPASLSTAALAAIRTISDKPIHFIVNTQAGEEHTGGNEALAKAGPTRPDRMPLGSGLGGNTGGGMSGGIGTAGEIGALLVGKEAGEGVIALVGQQDAQVVVRFPKPGVGLDCLLEQADGAILARGVFGSLNALNHFAERQGIGRGERRRFDLLL